MFIKLTRMDGVPVWINASFVVTVEPRKGGTGAIVVPIGDGLDYDVRESPETVLKMLEGAPEPLVVPVPSPDALAPQPEDVSPEPERNPPPEPRAAPPAEGGAGKARRTGSRAHPRTAAAGIAAAAGNSAKTEKPAASAPPDAPAEAAASAPETASASAGDSAAESAETGMKIQVSTAEAGGLTAEQLERLRKMAPRSVMKLTNTLAVQFHVAEPKGAIAALEAAGVLKLAHGHVAWA